MDEVTFAAELFTALTGEAAPELPTWWEKNRWAIVARPHDGDKERPLYEVEGRTVHLNLHAGQMEAWESEQRFVFIIAGTQSGKTSFEPWLLVRDVFLEDYDTGEGGDSLAVTATYDLFNLKLLPAMREVFEDVLGIARWHGGERVLELRNPKTGEFDGKRATDGHLMFGRIILRSASTSKSGKTSQTSDGGGLESATAKRAILDECGQDSFSFNAWKAIRRRLSLAQGRVYAGTTPYNLGWLKQMIYDPWEKKERNDVQIVQFASILNPAFSIEEYNSARGEMQDHEFEMMYQGIFGRPHGAIYHMFDEKYKHDGGHKVARFDVPKDWARYEAVDPGIINTAKLWVAYDNKDDVYYVYRAWMGERLTAKEHAVLDMELEKQNGERVIKRAIGAKSETYWREDYKAAGASGVVGPDTNDVEEGIDRVVTLLKQHRMYFFDDLIELIGEVLSYSRIINELGEVTDDIRNKSAYHLVDSLRYMAILLVKGRDRKSRQAESVSYVK